MWYNSSSGSVAEWFKAHAWKACKGETLSEVRILSLPPFFDRTAKMKILAIETSCDETAAAVVAADDAVLAAARQGDQTAFARLRPEVLSNVVKSQIDIFAEYGGVIPEVAARSHLEVILPVVQRALDDAACDWSQVDAIAVTHTPGLNGYLLIGTLTARTLANLHDKPLYPVHHLKSHIFASWLELGEAMPPQPPILALVVSGGHTQIIKMPDYNQFEIIGTTRDDAVGECFDKVAKILGLPYPGGPAIAQAAAQGDSRAYRFPHPQVAGLDFSFSGLKTAVLRRVQTEVGKPIDFPSHLLAPLLSEKQVADFAASFQETVATILVEKLRRALDDGVAAKSLVVAGGVSANVALRQAVQAEFGSEVQTFFPALKYCGDNGAMVGAAALFEVASGVQPCDPYHLDIMPRSAIH